MKRYDFKVYRSAVEASCTRCRPIFKMRGDILISYDHPEEGIDGKPAFRLFWKCRCAGHVRPIGYTRPVDFAKGKYADLSYDETHLDEDPTEEYLTHKKYY